MSKYKAVTKIILLLLPFLFLSSPIISFAQSSSASSNFSGSDISNYYCPGITVVEGDETTEYHSTYGDPIEQNGRYLCFYNNGAIVRDAIASPPKLQQLEVWFVKILYMAWGLSGIVFTFILLYIGFLYMTSRGNDKMMADVKTKLRNWFVGLVLVFLSYPVLNTFFKVIGINEDACYYDITQTMPGFKFFFPTVCYSNTTADPDCLSACLSTGRSFSACDTQCSSSN